MSGLSEGSAIRRDANRVEIASRQAARLANAPEPYVPPLQRVPRLQPPDLSFANSGAVLLDSASVISKLFLLRFTSRLFAIAAACPARRVHF
jgi:hypothetical protein